MSMRTTKSVLHKQWKTLQHLKTIKERYNNSKSKKMKKKNKKKIWTRTISNRTKPNLNLFSCKRSWWKIKREIRRTFGSDIKMNNRIRRNKRRMKSKKRMTWTTETKRQINSLNTHNKSHKIQILALKR